MRCEGEGEKSWLNPTGRDVNLAGWECVIFLKLILLEQYQLFTFLQNVYSITAVSAVKKPQENVLMLKFNKIRKEHKGMYNCTMTIGKKKYNKGFKLIVISKKHSCI